MNSRKTLAEQLAQVALFERCTNRDLRIIARHAERSPVNEGAVIVRQGAAGDAFFLLLSGSARVVKDGVVVAQLGPGDSFGELALLDPAPRAATVVAGPGTEVAVLGARMFKVLLRELPAMNTALLAVLARMTATTAQWTRSSERPATTSDLVLSVCKQSVPAWRTLQWSRSGGAMRVKVLGPVPRRHRRRR